MSVASRFSDTLDDYKLYYGDLYSENLAVPSLITPEEENYLYTTTWSDFLEDLESKNVSKNLYWISLDPEAAEKYFSEYKEIPGEIFSEKQKILRGTDILHSVTGPALIVFKNNTPIKVGYFKFGNLDREDGGAALFEYDNNGLLKTVSWAKNGEYYRPNNLPTIVSFKHGKLEKMSWCNKGVCNEQLDINQ